jgi:glucose/arabinose dehydrogenase
VLRAAALLAAALAVLAAGASARPHAAAIKLQRVATGLDSPVHLTWAPGEPGRLYVVEQPGRVRVIQNGRLLARPFLDLRPLVGSGGERGLLSVAFHPNYAKNRRLFVDYTGTDGNTRIAELRSDGRTALPGSRKQWLLVRQPYGNHNGGQIAFGPDGRLYIGTGDGGAGGDPEDRAQNLASLHGKLLALNVNRAGARPQLTALGLRNPWRFSFDRATGDLWIGDVGQGAREEIDWTPRAQLGRLRNYGWDVWEGSTRFEEKPPSRGELVFPVWEYGRDSGCSVTGGHVYRGKAIPAAVGRYFFGDYCTGNVWSLKLAGGKATGHRREPFRVAGLTSFGEDARGELYAVSHGGSVFRLVR